MTPPVDRGKYLPAPNSTHTLFCDETGSTGSNFLDPEQPVFAEGGWFIAHTNRSAAMNAIVEIENKYSFGAIELKGANLVKKAKGQAMMRMVCEAVGKNGGIPYVFAVEKRYAVCSKIVETFLDPVYNPKIPTSDTWDPEKRQGEAQFLYEHGGALIDEFANAYRIKDPHAVKANAQEWSTKLASAGFQKQADRISGVIPKIEEEIIDEARHDASANTPSGMDSLNLPIVAEVFQFVEQKCPYPCDIVHDKNDSFEAVFRFAFDLYSKPAPSIIEMKDGRRMRLGFKNALSLSFAESKAQPLIRAADYLLAGTRKFIHLATATKEIPEDITWITFGSLGAILMKALTLVHPSLDGMPELSGYMSSDEWRDCVFGRLKNELSKIAIPN